MLSSVVTRCCAESRRPATLGAPPPARSTALTVAAGLPARAALAAGSRPTLTPGPGTALTVATACLAPWAACRALLRAPGTTALAAPPVAAGARHAARKRRSAA